MALPSSQTTREWAVLTVVVGSRAYRAMLLTLVAIAVAPLLLAWQPFVIKSGSMEPSITAGDVAVGRPFADDEKIAVGRVYMFDDPSTSEERILVHRVVELRDDHTYTTAGDANAVTDFTPITPDDVRARAILLVPYVGLPIVWMQAGQWVPLGLWLLLTMAAFFLATRNVDGEPPRWTPLRLLREHLARRRTATTATPSDKPRESVLLRAGRATAAVLAICLLGGTVSTANATFTTTTRNSGSTWTVGQWLLPYVQAVMADNPTGFWLLDETTGVWAQDRSGNKLTGRYGPAVTLGHPGSLPNNPGTSVRPGNERITLNPSPIGAPQTSSNEIWFKTTSTNGGTLFGFEPSTASDITDRLLKMQPDGRLVYGDWNANPYRTTATPAAYNDGQWHHVVISATRQGNRQVVTIFVDGQQVATGESSAVGTSTGSWFVGPFDGFVDNAAIYNTNLTAAQVQAHYAAR